MGDFLTNLADGFPGKFCVDTCTSVTILVGNNILDHKNLLQDSRSKYFFLNSQFHFNSSAVRFSPNKGSVHKTNFVETYDNKISSSKKPFNFFKQRAKSSLLSSSHETQMFGGDKYLYGGVRARDTL